MGDSANAWLTVLSLDCPSICIISAAHGQVVRITARAAALKPAPDLSEVAAFAIVE